MTLFSRTYDQSYFQNSLRQSQPEAQRNRQRLRLVLEQHQQGRLLEIGPGTGGFLTLAARRFRVEGIEVSPHSLDHICPELRGCIRVGNIEDTLLATARYDVVAAFNVLEHLHQPACVAAKVRQALTKDGCLVGSVPCNAGIVGRVHTSIANFFDRTHCSTYEPEGWRAVFLDAGFTSIRFFGEVPFGPRYSLHIRSSIWRQVSPNLMFVCK